MATCLRTHFGRCPLSFAPATPAEGDGTDRYQRGVAASSDRNIEALPSDLPEDGQAPLAAISMTAVGLCNCVR
jgi:hypothetical protein